VVQASIETKDGLKRKKVAKRWLFFETVAFWGCVVLHWANVFIYHIDHIVVFT